MSTNVEQSEFAKDCDQPSLNVHDQDQELMTVSEQRLLQTFSASSESDFNEEISSSESSDDSENEIDIQDFSEQLRSWYSNNNITLKAFSELLKILKKQDPFTSLPCEATTFLRTPKISDIKPVAGGDYIHFGFTEHIEKLLDQEEYSASEVNLYIGIDGIPIEKSTKKSFWPILCIVEPLDPSPFPVGIWSGESKPTDSNEYLEEFVQELKHLMSTNIESESAQLKIKKVTFVCDAPARSFVTCTKGHTGYSCCLKCNIVGQQFKNRVIFTALNCPLRTNESFRRQLDEDHHKSTSIIEELDIDIPASFPYEFMHLICLGVMKKLVLCYLRGNYQFFRLSSVQVNLISQDLLNLRQYIVLEFNRKPRRLEEVDRFKATEFYQLLMYTGVVVLSRLPSDHYN